MSNSLLDSISGKGDGAEKITKEEWKKIKQDYYLLMHKIGKFGSLGGDKEIIRFKDFYNSLKLRFEKEKRQEVSLSKKSIGGIKLFFEQERVFSSLEGIYWNLDLFSLDYINKKFRLLFGINFSDFQESFQENNGIYTIQNNFSKELKENDKKALYRLRALSLLLPMLEKSKKDYQGISLGAGGGNAPIHFAHLQKNEDTKGIDVNKTYMVGSSAGALVGVFYLLAKKFHPNISPKEIYQRYYPKDLSNGFTDGMGKLEEFKEAFEKIITDSKINNNLTFSELRFSDLPGNLLVNFFVQDFPAIAGGDMFIEPYLAASVDCNFDDITVNTSVGEGEDLGIIGVGLRSNSNNPYRILQSLGIPNEQILLSDIIGGVSTPVYEEEGMTIYSAGTFSEDEMGRFDVEEGNTRFNKAYEEEDD